MSLANWPPVPPDSHNDLLANQNHLRSSRYVSNPPQLSTSSILISNNKYLAFLSTKKNFFSKKSHHDKKVCIKKSTFLEIKTSISCFSKFPKFSKLCTTIAAIYRVAHKGGDFRDDCTEFILSVSSWFPATKNFFVSLSNH